ncbi:unnamed protein product [marine sediment metagenome]|uniref:Uncharacterized protein n=1 Tax=marine sediment metagenome TaxID=412755 RepID=X1LSN5_9ZZZZ
MSRRVGSRLPVKEGIANGSLYLFRDPPLVQISLGEPSVTPRAAKQPIHKSDLSPAPSNATKRPYWTDPLDSTVKYAGGDPLDIEQVLASIVDKSTLKPAIIVLRDLHDQGRPLFLITTLTSRYFPRGRWRAYLYILKPPNPPTYQLVGSLALTIEPRQISPFHTWRYLKRAIKTMQHPEATRHIRKSAGLRF